MPKLKSKKAAVKRFSKTATGLLKHSSANHKHKTGKMAAKRKRRLRKTLLVDKTNVKMMKKITPYI